MARFARNKMLKNLTEQDRAILRFLVKNGEITRGELVDLLGLSPSTVSRRVQGLMDEGLLFEENGDGEGRGRRNGRLVFRKDAGYLIGVDLGANHLKIGISTLANSVITWRQEPVNMANGPTEILGRVIHLVNDLLDASHIPESALLGVGVGVPGPVNFQRGIVESPPIMPGWNQFPIKQYLQEQLRTTVFVDNDVNCLALGEHILSPNATSDMVFVKVATGVGAGIIIDNALHRGVNGCAGDIGHIRVHGSSRTCGCGKVGCLEAIASAPAIVAQAQLKAAEPGIDSALVDLCRTESLSAEHISTLARHGDRACSEIIKTVGNSVGYVLASLVNFFNPRAIVIGGGVSNSGDLLLASIRESVYKTAMPLATRDLQMARSCGRHDLGIIGAASLVVSDLLAN